MKSLFTEYTGHHSPVTVEVLKDLVGKYCHSEEIESVDSYGDFFGSNTWRIQSHSHAAGALQKPDGTLVIKDYLCWPLLSEHAEHAIVHITDMNEDGLFFYLKPKNTPDGKGCPDWHLSGNWPDFDSTFEEQSENDFVSDFDRVELEKRLRSLGFVIFVDDEE